MVAPDSTNQILQAIYDKFPEINFIKMNRQFPDSALDVIDAINQIPGGSIGNYTGQSYLTLYVSTLGQDLPENGSITSPYLSLEYAILNLPCTIIDTIVTIYIAAGTYNFSCDKFSSYLAQKRFLAKSSLFINGETSISKAGFSIVVRAPDSFNFDATGLNLLTNECKHQYLYHFANDQKFPILSNDNAVNSKIDSVYFVPASLNDWMIVKNEVTFNLLDYEFNIVTNYPAGSSQEFIFSHINFDAGINIFRLYNCNLVLDMKFCRFLAKSITIVYSFDRSSIWSSIFYVSTGGITDNAPQIQIRECIIEKSGARSGTAINKTANYCRPYRGVRIYNFSIGLACQSLNFMFNLANTMFIVNATTTITIRNNTQLLFSACPIYLDTLIPTTFLSDGETVYGGINFQCITITGIPINYLSANLKTLGFNNVAKDVQISLPGIPTSGTATLVGGTVTINTAAVQANSLILVSHKVTGGTIGILTVGAIVAGVSFVINSSNVLDTSSITWQIIG